MKFIIAFIGLSFLAACSSAPVIVRVKNCKDLGANIFDCEQIPKSDRQKN
jgi:hypothetical protein